MSIEKLFHILTYVISIFQKMNSMNCPVKSQSQGLTFHKTWNVVKEKPSRSGQSNLFSFYIPFDQIMFFPSSPSFFYSFLSRFVFALVQSSPIANDDLCWRFCCCHTKLVHSERLRNFRYYFFYVFWDFKASITEQKRAEIIIE